MKDRKRKGKEKGWQGRGKEEQQRQEKAGQGKRQPLEAREGGGRRSPGANEGIVASPGATYESPKTSQCPDAPRVFSRRGGRSLARQTSTPKEESRRGLQRRTRRQEMKTEDEPEKKEHQGRPDSAPRPRTPSSCLRGAFEQSLGAD